MAFNKSTDFRAFVCFKFGLIRLLCGLLVICHRKFFVSDRKVGEISTVHPQFANSRVFFSFVCCPLHISICQFSCRGKGNGRGSERKREKQWERKKEHTRAKSNPHTIRTAKSEKQKFRSSRERAHWQQWIIDNKKKKRTKIQRGNCNLFPENWCVLNPKSSLISIWITNLRQKKLCTAIRFFWVQKILCD